MLVFFPRLSQTDGSVELAMDATRVVCSVLGPLEAKARQELPTTAAVEVVFRPGAGVAHTREKVLEHHMRGVLGTAIAGDSYPRQVVQCVVQVVAAGEAPEFSCRELTAGINAAFLACVDAGVALRCSFGAVCVGVMNDGAVVVSPSAEQLELSASHHVVAYGLENGSATHLLLGESMGKFTEAQLLSVLDLLARKCEEVCRELRQAVEKKLAQDYVWRE